MTPPSIERRIAAYLAPGPEDLPEWVQPIVLEEIRHTAQARVRPPLLGRFAAVAALAGVVVLMVFIGAAMSGRVGLTSTGGLPRAFEPLPVASGSLDPEQMYRTEGFSLPITFRLPRSAEGAVVDLLDEHSLRLRPTGGGAITLHHDAALADDLCHPSALASALTTPEAVRDWLDSSPGITVGPERALPLRSGEMALAWDIALADDCWSGARGSVGEVVWLAAGETPRVYAIPVTGDVIVALTWGAGDAPGRFDEINPTADAVVQSIAAAGR